MKREEEKGDIKMGNKNDENEKRLEKTVIIYF